MTIMKANDDYNEGNVSVDDNNVKILFFYVRYLYFFVV